MFCPASYKFWRLTKLSETSSNSNRKYATGSSKDTTPLETRSQPLISASAHPRSSPQKLARTKQRRAEAEKKVQLALNDALAKSTRKRYDANVRKFVKFCESIGIDKHDALPCSDDTLCMFICDGLGNSGSSYAKSLISSIRSWHVRNGHNWNPSLRISLIKKALDRSKNHDTTTNTPRLPITPRMIRLLATQWQSGSNIELCALACATAAWIGQMRLGEVLPQSVALLEHDKLPKWKHWQPSGPEGSSSLTLPWTKTTAWKGDTVNFPRQPIPFDATTALTVHKRSSNLPTKALICEYREGGKRQILTKETFMAMCNSVWSKNGLARYTGHSFRIGGTTMLLRSGIAPDIVKKMGRWKSDAFQLYWRDINDIFNAQVDNLDVEDW